LFYLVFAVFPSLVKLAYCNN